MFKPMKRYALIYVTTLLAFGAIDALWLGTVAAPLYKRTLGPLMLEQFRVAPAVVFYLLQIAGMMVFVVPRTAGADALWRVALFGALYGLFTYATFDLTNYAVLRPWTFFLAWTDIAWGCVLSAAAATIGVWGGEALARALG
jgi:uncharacterized membrane protein